MRSRLLLRVAAAGACATLVIAPATALAAGSTTAQTPVLGVHHSFGPDSKGWGTARPKTLFNGGDPSGDITHIHWTSWGGKTAHGRGKNSVVKPAGGYYHKQVTIRLRATDLGTCKSSGKRAYRHLWFKEPSKPGGPFGHWHIWTAYHKNLCKRMH
ncbi:MAG TPA: hypothetical protein VME70_00405 [Mycobacteriales bacterium]|nr:hypothetical protein [Mycobacteriales bacterium]